MTLGLKKDFDSNNFGTIWMSNVLISHENSTISQKPLNILNICLLFH